MDARQEAMTAVRSLTDQQLAQGLEQLSNMVLGTKYDGFEPFMREAAERLSKTQQ